MFKKQKLNNEDDDIKYIHKTNNEEDDIKYIHKTTVDGIKHGMDTLNQVHNMSVNHLKEALSSKTLSAMSKYDSNINTLFTSFNEAVVSSSAEIAATSGITAPSPKSSAGVVAAVLPTSSARIAAVSPTSSAGIVAAAQPTLSARIAAVSPTSSAGIVAAAQPTSSARIAAVSPTLSAGVVVAAQPTSSSAEVGGSKDRCIYCKSSKHWISTCTLIPNDYRGYCVRCWKTTDHQAKECPSKHKKKEPWLKK